MDAKEKKDFSFIWFHNKQAQFYGIEKITTKKLFGFYRTSYNIGVLFK